MLEDVRRAIGCRCSPTCTRTPRSRRWPRWSTCCRRPAFLCRQTNFILNTASQGKPVNIKKGQFLSPWEMKNVVDKARSTGNARRSWCASAASPSATTTWSSDMRSLSIMRDTGCPVVFDATHSVQLPGGQGHRLRRAARIHPGAGARRGRRRHRRDSSWRRTRKPGAGALGRPQRLAARRAWSRSSRTLTRARPRRQGGRRSRSQLLMSRISAVTRPRDPRFARQPHRRSRRTARFGHARARRGALGRLDRHPRGGRAARRRPTRYGGKGVLKAVEHINTVAAAGARRVPTRAIRRASMRA